MALPAQKTVPMYKSIKQVIFITSIVGGFTVAGCKDKNSTLPYYNTPDFTPVWSNDNEQKTKHQIADFAFTNQYGKTVSNATLDNKLYAANFFFTACGSICPTMTKNLRQVQQHFKSNGAVAFVSYSVMPRVDSVSRLQHYAKLFEVDSNWHLLTGNKGAIYALARQSYFAEEEPGYNKDSTDFLHTEHVLLIDKKRHIRGIYNGTLPLDMQRLITDMEALLKED